MFKKGDRVVYTGKGRTCVPDKVGQIGTVISGNADTWVDKNRPTIGIRFDIATSPSTGGYDAIYVDNLTYAKQYTLQWIKERL
jgi:hypothetical protein